MINTEEERDLAMKPARVRFAPSPTGLLHLGGARTALIDYLIARQTGGQFILRIEDTDRNRYVPEAEQGIFDSLHWLGLEWDEGPDKGGPYAPYRQSERKEIYLEYAHQLIESDHAYYCFCSPERLHRLREEQQRLKLPHMYDGLCRKLTREEAEGRIANGEQPVIRFKSPREGITTVHDVSRGDIVVDNRTLDDFILVRSDGLALYHLNAMVDDHLMKITHVVRGSEWLPTFPLHALIYRAFGWEEPAWIHLSVFLKPSGKGKMSKRDAAESIKDGHSIFIQDMEGLGYLPEAVVNWIALMGWSYDDRTEFFTREDLVEKFSIEKLNPSPAAINFSKLDHFNGLHIRNLPVGELAKRLKPYFEDAGYRVSEDRLEKVVPLIQERMVTLDDGPRISGFFFEEDVHPPAEELVAKKLTAKESRQVAEKVYEVLSGLPDVSHAQAEPAMRALVDELGLKAGQVFGIMRVAITGRTVSPPLFESMQVIGKQKVLERMQNAIEILQQLEDKELGD
jgi:glutamyl-tRNA synthetase